MGRQGRPGEDLACHHRRINEPTPTEFVDLLAGARANAPWAWDRLYRAYAPRVLGSLRLRDAAHAEDVLGEVFVEVVRHLDRFEGGADEFGAWLFRIAHNRFVDDHRRRRRRTEASSASPPEVADRDVADVVAERDAARRMEGLLRILPPDQRSVTYLRSVLDMPFADVAGAMGRSEGSVKMLHARALQTLGKRLDALGPDGAGRP